MSWLSRFTVLAWRSTTPSAAAFRHHRQSSTALWLERLEDRQVLDAAAVLLAGDLFITGDHNGLLNDQVALSLTDDGFGGQLLQVLDHGMPVEIDLGAGFTSNQIDLSQLTGGRIQFNLGSGDDQLLLQIPAAETLPNGLQLIVNNAAGNDTTTFVASGSTLDSSSALLEVASETLIFAPGFGGGLVDVGFDLTGDVMLDDNLSLNTAGGAFHLQGSIQSANESRLDLVLGGGDLSVNGGLGSAANRLGAVDIDGAGGDISLASIFANGPVSIEGHEVILHGITSDGDIHAEGTQLTLNGDLMGEDVTLVGTTHLTGSRLLQAAGSIDTSAAILQPGSADADLTFEAGGDLQLGIIQGQAPLGWNLDVITIINARDVDLDGAVTAGGLVQQAGSGVTTINASLNLLTATGLSLTTQSIVSRDGSEVTTAGPALLVAVDQLELQGAIVSAGAIRAQAANHLVLSGTLTSANETVTLQANGDLELTSAARVQSTSGEITLIADANADSDGFGGALTMADGARVLSETGAISMSADESITLAAVQTGNASAAAVSIISNNGAIIDGGDISVDILADQPGAVVTLRAATGIGSGNALEANVFSLNVQNLTSGDLQINALNDLNVVRATQAGPGLLELITSGQLTILPTSGTANVTTTIGSLNLSAGSLTIGGEVRTTTGDIEISSGGDATLSATVHSDSGSIHVEATGSITLEMQGTVSTANAINMTAGGAISMRDGAVVNSSAATVRLLAGEDITLGQVSAQDLVTITTNNGAILDGGDSSGVDIVASQIALRAATGVGIGVSLEVSTSTLAILNQFEGDISVTNQTPLGDELTLGTVDGLSGIANLGSGEGGISVSSDGSIRVVQPVLDLAGGGLELLAQGAESDLVIEAPVHAALLTGIVQLGASRDLILTDTGFADDVRGQRVIGTAGREVLFDEFSGVIIRSATGTVVSPTPRLENLQTPQIGADGISQIKAEFGHLGASNFYFIVLWDPAFIDRIGLTPVSFAGQPIVSLNNSQLPAGTAAANLPPEFAALLALLVTRQAEVGSAVVDGYDPLALEKLNTAGYSGEGVFTADHFYAANPNKDVPYNPAADIPISVRIFDDANITFMAAGRDLGQAEISGLAGVPGDGLQGGVFYFDLSIVVPPLEAPRVVVNDAASTGQTTVTLSTDVEETQVLIEADVVNNEQFLIIEKIKLDGTIARLPNGTLIRRELVGEEVSTTLADLPELFNRLREGRWRIYLQQGEDGQPQLIRDVELREGKPAGDDAGTQDRPPTGKS